MAPCGPGAGSPAVCLMQEHHQPQKQTKGRGCGEKNNNNQALFRYVKAGAQAAIKDVQGTITVTVS